MTRINILVEGPTEESFVKNVLAPSLWYRETYLSPILLGVPGHKGGRVNYERVKKDLVLQLKQDQTAYCSTMFDLYGLGGGFPGMPFAANITGLEKALQLEENLSQSLLEIIPQYQPDVRFIPYFQVHEYEGLLFSDPEAFAIALGNGSLSRQLGDIRHSVVSPEDINDGPLTAPSKRLLLLYPSYKKVIEGTLAAKEVGITRMRQECPHFNRWIERLESASPLT